MRKKGLPDVFVRAVISLYCGAKTKVRVGPELFEKFWVQVGVYQKTVLLSLLFVIAVDIIMENARESLMCEMCADDLVLMSESVKNLREKFLK